MNTADMHYRVLSVFHLNRFSLRSHTPFVHLFRVPSLMKDLLRLCFSSSPYELAVDPSKNLIDAKDEDRTYFSSMESSAGSSIFSSSFQVFSAGSMSSGELMHSSSGINDGTASHSNVPLIVPTKKGFSSMELFTKHMKKPMQCRVGEVIVKKIKVEIAT